MKNRANRPNKHFWQRCRNVVAPLAELWASFLDAPLDWRNTAAVASGLRTIYMNLEQNAHNNLIHATPAATSCWRSTFTTIIQLTTCFDTECQFERYRTRLNYSLRERKLCRPQLMSAVHFRVEIDVGEQLDSMMTHSMNAILHHYVVAGVALLRHLKEQNITIDADIKLFRDVYE